VTHVSFSFAFVGIFNSHRDTESPENDCHVAFYKSDVCVSAAVPHSLLPCLLTKAAMYITQLFNDCKSDRTSHQLSLVADPLL